MRDNNNFLQSLAIVAGQLGQKLGVRVVLGNGCCTDGQKIILPTWLCDQNIRKEELLGMLVHEAGHIRFTDMDAATERCNGKPPILFRLINAVEDARIELLMEGVYAGARYLLETSDVDCRQILQAPAFKANPMTAYALYPLVACQATYRPKEIPSRDVLRSQCVGHFGEEIMAKVDQELLCFPNLKNTTDVVDLGERLLQILLDSLPKSEDEEDSQSGQNDQSDPSDSNDSQDQSESDNRQGQGSSNSSNSSQDEGEDEGSRSSADSESESDNEEKSSAGESRQNEGSSSESKAAGKSGSQSSSSDGNADSSSTSESSEDSSSEDGQEDSSASGKGNGKSAGGKASKRITKAIQKALGKRDKVDQSLIPSEAIKQKVNEAQSESSEETLLGEYNLTAPKPLKIRDYSGSKATLGTERLTNARKESVKARKALQGIIQAKARVGSYTANSGRRIQKGCLTRVCTGNTRIFERREEATAPDTSVSLLLDLSGSVDNNDEDVIRAGLALTEALRTMQGVKTQMCVFPSSAVLGKSYDEIAEEQTDVYEVIPFGGDPRRHLKEIGALRSWGATPLAESLVQLSTQIAARPESRKIIIVVTDGAIATEAATITRKLVKSGVVMVGLGIGLGGYSRQTLSKVFPIWEVLEFGKLQETLMKISRRLLLEGFQFK